MEVSIIIATRNALPRLAVALDSLLAMTWQDWECVVVDGASTDGTQAMVEQYCQRDGRFRLISEPDHGVYDAFNKGWRAARGTWVHYLGSDDRMTPDGLSQLISQPIGDDIDVVSGHCWAIKTDGQLKEIRSRDFYGCHQGKLTRRTALAEMGGFDLRYRILADMDLYARMRAEGRTAEVRDCHVAWFCMDGASQRLPLLWDNARERLSIYRHDPAERHPLWHTFIYTMHTLLSILYRRIRKFLHFGVTQPAGLFISTLVTAGRLLGLCLPVLATARRLVSLCLSVLFSSGWLLSLCLPDLVSAGRLACLCLLFFIATIHTVARPATQPGPTVLQQPIVVQHQPAAMVSMANIDAECLCVDESQPSRDGSEAAMLQAYHSVSTFHAGPVCPHPQTTPSGCFPEQEISTHGDRTDDRRQQTIGQPTPHADEQLPPAAPDAAPLRPNGGTTPSEIPKGELVPDLNGRRPSEHRVFSLWADITAEGALGNGTYTPHYLTANRFGSLSSQASTAYVSILVAGRRDYTHWHLSGGIEVQGQVDDYTPYYLQQCYLRAEGRWAYLSIGAYEQEPLLRDRMLSSGSLVWSGNSRPLPQVQIGTAGFISLTGKSARLSFLLDVAFGLTTDSHYLEDRYSEYLDHHAFAQGPGQGYGQSFLTTEAQLHHKRLYLRTDPDQRLVATVGIEHAVQFGGKTVNYINNTIDGPLHTNIQVKDYFKALIPSAGDASATAGDRRNAYGNHLGEYSLTLDCRLSTSTHLLAYGEKSFEDGSGMKLNNGWDGLWGLEYRGISQRWVQSAAVEYLQTTHQSGPEHWSSNDHGNAIGQANGSDDYYNNYFYCAYALYGQAIGSPMLLSPAYNSDSYLRFAHNRIRAWHVGVRGRLVGRDEHAQHHLDYRLLASQRESYGTMAIPSPHVCHSTDLMLALDYHCGPWLFVLAGAFSRGSLYGDNSSVDLRIARHLTLVKSPTKK